MEKRKIDRNIRGIEREETKVKREIQVMAKRGSVSITSFIFPIFSPGDVANAKTLARELVRSKKAKERHVNTCSSSVFYGQIGHFESPIEFSPNATCSESG